MARKNVADAAKAKAEKQKKIAIGLVVLLALAGAYAVHTMMALNSGGGAREAAGGRDLDATDRLRLPRAVGDDAAAGCTDAERRRVPTDSTAAAPNGSSQLVDAVPTSAGTGQLQSFSLFESKDPFNAGGPGSTSTGTQVLDAAASPASTSKPPKTPPAPPTAPTRRRRPR